MKYLGCHVANLGESESIENKMSEQDIPLVRNS